MHRLEGKGSYPATTTTITTTTTTAPCPEDEKTMDKLRQERLKFICREQDVEGITQTKYQSSEQQQQQSKDSSDDVRLRRKSHPWKTDVKLNRFGGTAPSSRTQKSTMGWKQRMQERRAVFGNVAVMEDTHGEEQEDDDDEESIGTDDDQLHLEAHELLRDKGFQGLPPPTPSPPHSSQTLSTEILEQNYEDDLVSVGAGESLASGKNEQAARLAEIQSLRQQILSRHRQHQQLRDANGSESLTIVETEEDRLAQEDENDDEAEMFPEMDEEELAFYTFKKQRLLQAMMQRVASCSPRGVEKVTEVVGNAWTRELAGEQPSAEANSNGVAAWRVMKELKVRLQDVYTEDHVMVVAMGRKGTDDDAKHKQKITFDQNAFNRHKLRDAVEKRVSLVYKGDHHVVSNHDKNGDKRDVDSSDSEDADGNRLDSSFSNDVPTGAPTSLSTPRSSPVSPAAMRQSLSESFGKFENLLGTRKPEDDEWTECSMSVADPRESLLKAVGMLPALPRKSMALDDDQSIYTEYTLETVNEAVMEHVAKEEPNDNGGEMDDSRRTAAGMDDSRKTVKFSNAQQQAYVHRQFRRDDQSFMELTVQDPYQDDHSSMELTIQDNSGRTPTKPSQTHHFCHASADDDKSYMEFTVPDTVASNDSLENNNESPYMSTLLSSRMFADMGLPSDLKKQQKQTPTSANDDENYPTITVGHAHDDDDMTQITFDQAEWEEHDATQDHYHAMSYLQKNLDGFSDHSGRTDATMGAGVLKSPHRSDASRRSLRSEDTDPTADESSSHNEAASFKSCMSSESSQSVAKLLRQDVWSRDAGVVSAALEKLANIAAEGYQSRIIIMRYGGLLAIVRAIEMNHDHVSVLVAACAALEKLALDADTQFAIAEVGGLPSIANAMKAQIDRVDVQKAACNVLANLTCHQERPSDDAQLPTEGLIEAIILCMTRHVSVPDIQANAFKALANLCLESTARLKELSDLGGLAAMTMALQKQWPNKMDQHEAISTLSILLRSLAELDQ